MTVVVLGLDALDSDLVDRETHQNLTLAHHRPIDTIVSSAGQPSTHELWPTIITGLAPTEHGITLDDGVAWGNHLLEMASNVADWLVPQRIQTRIGAWLLTNTSADAFRTPASYYESHELSTVFDGHESLAISIPNYVTDLDVEDREHLLRRRMGDLFERDIKAKGGHTSADPVEFYEWCLEMLMVRIARVRRGLRSQRYELIFGYTSALDLVGHVSYDTPELQARAYEEANEFVGELVDDLSENDVLLIVSDHGLQNGMHTDEAMVAGSEEAMVENIESVLDVRDAIEYELGARDHVPESDELNDDRRAMGSDALRQQLEELGYI